MIPLWERFVWGVVRFVFLPAMLIAGLATVVLLLVGLVGLITSLV